MYDQGDADMHYAGQQIVRLQVLLTAMVKEYGHRQGTEDSFIPAVLQPCEAVRNAMIELDIAT